MVHSLYRYECQECGEFVHSDDEWVGGCPSCGAVDDGEGYALMVQCPSIKRDKELAVEPPEYFECPRCGERVFGFATAEGRDWICWESGGCMETGWVESINELDPPKKWDVGDVVGYEAWSRLQRFELGEYEYLEEG